MKNPLAELVFVLADAMPEEMLLESVSDAIEKYKTDKSEDNESTLRAALTMLTTKFQCNDEGLDSMRKRFAEFETAANIFSDEKKN